MRMKLCLFNASSKPLFSVGAGNLPETCGEAPLERVALQRVINTFHGEPENRMSTERKQIRQFTLAYCFCKLGIA